MSEVRQASCRAGGDPNAVVAERYLGALPKATIASGSAAAAESAVHESQQIIQFRAVRIKLI